MYQAMMLQDMFLLWGGWSGNVLILPISINTLWMMSRLGSCPCCSCCDALSTRTCSRTCFTTSRWMIDIHVIACCATQFRSLCKMSCCCLLFQSLLSDSPVFLLKRPSLLAARSSFLEFGSDHSTIHCCKGVLIMLSNAVIGWCM